MTQHKVIEMQRRKYTPKANRDIRELDLSRFQNKLHEEYPDNGWDGDKFHIAVSEYKRFLELKILYPMTRLSPTRLMDEIWHSHILDTRQYHADCIRIFGKYLHHSPRFSYAKSQGPSMAKVNLISLYNKVYKSSPKGDGVSGCYDICQQGDGACADDCE